MGSAIRETLLVPIIPTIWQSRTAAEAVAVFWGWYLLWGRDYDWERHVFVDNQTMLLESREYLEEGLRKEIHRQVQQWLNEREADHQWREIFVKESHQSTELRLALAAYGISPEDFAWPPQCTTHLVNFGEVGLEIVVPSLGRAYIPLWNFDKRHSEH